MTVFVDDFLNDCHIAVIAVVRHRNHGCRGKTPTEAARAHLRVKLIEEIGFDACVRERIWVLGQALCQQGPLLEQLLLVLERVLDQISVLRMHDVPILPMAEEFDIGHHVEVWLPETFSA